MKKFLALVLTLALSFSMAACGSSQPTESAEDTEGKATLKVATSPDYSPMEFVDLTKSGQDKYVGFDISLAKYIASELGMELEICPMSFDACQVAVQTGNVDMSISGFSWSEEREKNYNLSDYYFAGDNETEQVTIALKDKAADLAEGANYKDKTVGVQTASLQEALVNAQLVPQGAKTAIFTDINTGILQLKKGDFDALAVAKGNGEAIVANNPDIVLTDFQFEVSEKEANNLILLQKGNDELTEKVNAILAKALEEGLYAQWYEEAQQLAGMETSGEVSFDDNGEAVEDAADGAESETESKAE